MFSQGLTARAIERQVQLGNYNRVKAMWPWPSPVRVVVTLNTMAAAVLMETWMLDTGTDRAVEVSRR